MRPLRSVVPGLCATLVALTPLACGGDADAGSRIEVAVDTVADTVVVRTLSGSTWGETARLVPEVSIGVLDGEEHLMFGTPVSLAVAADGRIFVMDRQVLAVRVFAADGSYLRTLGRDGGGPGEFGGPDGGMVWLSDGRLVVRDPGNARLQVFDADLEPSEAWPVIRGGFNTSNPMYRSAGDTLLTPVLMSTEVDVSEWTTGLQRVDPGTGEILDTLEVPDIGYEAPTIEARHESEGGTSVSVNGVPFSPSEHWAYHPGGYFIHGIGDRYRVTLLRPESPLRIERAVQPVPVAPGEKAEAERAATRNMRNTDPGWSWDGPGIPDAKPAFTDLYTGRDGRIWVRVPMPGVEGDDPDYDPTDPDAVEDRWSEPIAFDVFEDDGTFLGRVEAPADMSLYPTPIFDGDRVWAVTRDEFDVPRIVRFRVAREGERVAEG